MARYRMDDGTVVDTERSAATWQEASYWDGHNHCSRATGSQWEHQQLYRSRKGRYYLEHTSQQGHRPHVEWISREEAARWLLSQDEELPPDLADLAAEILE